MRNLIHWMPVLFIIGGSACDGRSSGRLPAEPRVPNFSVAGSPCHAVAFTVVLTPSGQGPFSFNGVATGDLEGTLTFEFDPSSVTLAGITISNSGTATWSITGGVIGSVDFTTHFDNRNLAIDRPGSPGDVFENIGRHRALAGVEMANLNYHGTFVISPTPEARHDYRGAICL